MTDKKYMLPSLSDTIFTVVVGTGDATKSFVPHEDIACARSGFFRACLSGDWKESIDAWVELPVDDPEVFQLYTQSLYASNMHQADSGHPNAIYNSISKTVVINRMRYRFLTKLYFLSDKMVDVQAKDHAVEVISELLSRDFIKRSENFSKELVEMITTVWVNTPVDAPIRRLIVDSVARGVPLRPGHFTQFSDAPPDFLVSVIEALGDLMRLDKADPSLSTLGLGDYMQSVTPQAKPDPQKYRSCRIYSSSRF